MTETDCETRSGRAYKGQRTQRESALGSGLTSPTTAVTPGQPANRRPIRASPPAEARPRGLACTAATPGYASFLLSPQGEPWESKLRDTALHRCPAGTHRFTTELHRGLNVQRGQRLRLCLCVSVDSSPSVM